MCRVGYHLLGSSFNACVFSDRGIDLGLYSMKTYFDKPSTGISPEYDITLSYHESVLPSHLLAYGQLPGCYSKQSNCIAVALNAQGILLLIQVKRRRFLSKTDQMEWHSYHIAPIL